jgi:hypothetical protein
VTHDIIPGQIILDRFCSLILGAALDTHHSHREVLLGQGASGAAWSDVTL